MSSPANEAPGFANGGPGTGLLLRLLETFKTRHLLLVSNCANGFSRVVEKRDRSHQPLRFFERPTTKWVRLINREMYMSESDLDPVVGTHSADADPGWATEKEICAGKCRNLQFEIAVLCSAQNFVIDLSSRKTARGGTAVIHAALESGIGSSCSGPTSSGRVLRMLRQRPKRARRQSSSTIKPESLASVSQCVSFWMVITHCAELTSGSPITDSSSSHERTNTLSHKRINTLTYFLRFINKLLPGSNAPPFPI